VTPRRSLPSPPPDDATRLAAGELLAAASGSPRPAPHLVAVRGPAAGARLALHDGAVLGRARTAPVRLADAAASRRHLRFRVRRGVVAVEDLGSKNGVTVNGEPLGPASRALGAGDRIALGDSVLELELPAAPPARGVPEALGAAALEAAGAGTGADEPPGAAAETAPADAVTDLAAPSAAPRALPPRRLALLAASAALLAAAAALGLAA
jgi:predicted component of type VI protein secretion system